MREDSNLCVLRCNLRENAFEFSIENASFALMVLKFEDHNDRDPIIVLK